MNNEKRPNYLRNVKFTQLCLSVCLFGIFLTPNIKVTAGIPALRLDDLTPIFWIVIMTLFSQKISCLSLPRIIPLFGLLFLLPISILAGSIGGYDNSIGELTQYVRLIKYILIYLLAAEFINRTNDILWLLRRVAVLGICLTALAVTQYFNVFGLNALYIPMVAPTQFLTLVNGYPVPRVVGMTGGPNEAAMLFALASISSLYAYVKYDRKLFLLAWAVCFLGVGMTGSRTGLVAGGVGILTLSALYIFPHLKLKTLVFPTFICLSGALIISRFANFDLLLIRFLEVSTISDSASWNARVVNWEINMKMASENILFGVGPLTRAGLGSADNDWLLIQRSYGIFGVGAVLWVVLGRTLLMRKGPACTMALALGALSGVAMIPGSVFHSLIIMPLLLILFAGLDQSENLKNNPTEKIQARA